MRLRGLVLGAAHARRRIPLVVVGVAALLAVGAAGAAQLSNHAPQAVDDTFTVDNSPVVTFPASGPGSPAANDTDSDGDSLSVTAVSKPARGTVSLSGGQITFRFNTSVDICDSAGGFQYTVSDGHGGTATGHVKLVVSCGGSSPHTIGLSPSTIAENQPSGTTVGTLSLTAGSSDGATFALVSGSGSGDNGSFTIDGSTLESADTFDYESKSSYSIRVRATPSGSTSSIERALRVAVTDANDAPTNIALSSTHVTEGQPSGTAVGDFSATDQDAGQTYSYALVSGSGSSDNGSFSIDGSTLETAETFDYHTKSSYSIRVHVADDGSPSKTYEKQFTISVDRVNHNPVTQGDSYVGTTDEGLLIATSDLVHNDTDADGDALTVTAVSNPVGGTVSLEGDSVLFSAGDACGDGTGGFDYTVSDGFGGSAQGHATIDLWCAPTVTTDPSSTSVVAGDTASFTSAASSDPAPTVQWQASTDGGSTWNDIPGETDSTLSFTVADGDNGSEYRAVWTNEIGATPSQPATLTVVHAPAVTSEPADQTVDAGGTASFTATASGLPAPDVQWQVSTDGGGQWSDVDGATSTTLSFTVAAGDDGNQYRAEFTNAAGTAISNAATLSVNMPPSADDQPVSTDEDTLETITLSGGDADGNALTFTIVSGPSHGALGSIGTPSCTGSPSVCTAAVDYTPAANYNGADSFTFRTNDGTDDSSTATVSITVNAVNDVPSFTKGADQVVEVGAGPQTVNGWATAISAGPPDESGQAVHFTITADSVPGLFSVPPAVSPSGVLTYTLAPATLGVATIMLDVQDDGGAANGGVDTSATQSFTITVDAPPTFDSSTPTSGATGVALDSTIELDFSESVNASTSSFTLECPTATGESFNLTPTSPASSYVLHPTASLPVNTTCTVTVVAAQITDADSSFHPDSDSTFSFQTVALPPAATADSYTATGNVGLTMPAASGVTQNDTLNGGTLHGFGATSGAADAVVPNGSNTVTTSNGGTVALSSDGSFTYDPPPGYTGADSFYYDLHSGAGDSVGQATVTVSHMIWFVDNTAGAGDGRLDHPFNSLSSLASINSGSAPHPQSGDTIFVYSGSGAYTGGITLRSSQLLIGQGAGASIPTISGITLAPHSNALPATGGTAPTFTSATGNDVTLGSGNTIRGVTLGDRTGSAISGSSFGTLTVQGDVSITGSGQALSLSNGALNVIFVSVTSTSGTNGVILSGDTGSLFIFGGALSGSSGDEFVVSGGSANVTDHGTIAKTGGGKALNVSGETGGTVTDTAAITDTDGLGSGISLTSNTGATITLTGGMQLSTGSSTAFTATGGGTVNVDNTNGTNTLTTTSATALTVSSTTIGATGLKFQSISSSGGTAGINLSSTGSTGGLTVSGTGSANSGGTIQSATTAGVLLSSTSSVSLSYMQIKSNTEGIKGTSVSGFTLANSTVSGNGGAAGQHGLDFSGGLTGTASITSSTITTSADDNVVVTDSSGTLSLTVTGSTLSSTGTSATGDGLLVNANGTSSVTVSATGSHFTNNHGAQLDVESTSSGSNTVTFSSNTVTESGTVAGGGLIIAAANSSSTTLTVDSNTITGAQLNAIKLYDNGATGGYHGTVDGNTIGSPSVVCSGSVQSNDIDAEAKGSTTQTLAITNNHLYQYNNWAGINTEGSVGSPTQNFTITGNTIADPVPTPSSCSSQGGSLWGLTLDSGALTGDAGVVCANISGNSMTGSSPSAAYGGIDDFEFDEYGNGIFRFPSYGGGSTDSNALVSYIQGRNASGGSPSGDTFIQGSGQGGGYFFDTAGCPTPP